MSLASVLCPWDGQSFRVVVTFPLTPQGPVLHLECPELAEHMKSHEHDQVPSVPIDEASLVLPSSQGTGDAAAAMIRLALWHDSRGIRRRSEFMSNGDLAAIAQAGRFVVETVENHIVSQSEADVR